MANLNRTQILAAIAAGQSVVLGGKLYHGTMTIPSQPEIDAIYNAGVPSSIQGVGTGKITVSDTEPSNPSEGDVWVDTSA